MEVRFHRSVDEFRALAEEVYGRDPVTNTIELTLLRGPALPDHSMLLTLWDDAGVLGAGLQTPLYPLSCNGIPESSADAAAAQVHHVRPGLTGVRGLRRRTAAFAEAWRARSGHGARLTREERLYRLGTLCVPPGVAGSSRVAGASDRALLVSWAKRFFIETFGPLRDWRVGEKLVADADARGDRFVVWTVDDAPTSMAMLRAPAAGVSRIGPVYTPRDQRGRGYGSAVTAAAADLARAEGVADVVLFADLANPVSNAIYQRIGFEPVSDSVYIDFDLPADRERA